MLNDLRKLILWSSGEFFFFSSCNSHGNISEFDCTWIVIINLMSIHIYFYLIFLYDINPHRNLLFLDYSLKKSVIESIQNKERNH